VRWLMKGTMRAQFLVAAVFIATMGSSVSADPVRWELRGVEFGKCFVSAGRPCVSAGEAQGFFTYDSDTDLISDWRIEVRGGDTTLFPELSYSTDQGAAHVDRISPAPAPFFLFSGPPSPTWGGRNRQLRLAFEGQLNNAGGTLRLDVQHPWAGECYDCAPWRPLSGGFVTSEAAPVPEPGTVALLGIGLAALGLRARRRASTVAPIAAVRGCSDEESCDTGRTARQCSLLALTMLSRTRTG